MLSISNLCKTYSNGVKAMKGINLKIGKGIFGLLGPNGSGKSTLMRTIATLQDPDSGSIVFDGINVLKEKESIRKTLGYLPQEFGVYPNVSAEELLNHLAILKGIIDNKKRKAVVSYLLEMTNLSDHRKKKLAGFSGGMKQRFGIGQALLGNPRMIIVDEPTAGLDPEERTRFHNLLSKIGKDTLVILSTHIVSDVSRICNDMAIISSGQVLVKAAPEDAIETLRGKVWESKVADLDETSYKILGGSEASKVFSEEPLGAGFELIEPNLEDVYFAYTKGYMGGQHAASSLAMV